MKVEILLQNYSQRLEMQNTQENINLDKFLKTHFKFPSNNLGEINRLIVNDNEMTKERNRSQ